MSYTYNDIVKISDSNLDAFGRVKTSGITTLIDIKHLYSKQPLLVDEAVGGSGTSVHTNSSVSMSVVHNGDFVIRQSFKSAPYQSGKAQLFEASFSNFAIETDVIKRVGYFTSTTSAAATPPYGNNFDGFFLESDGTTGDISFQIWQDGANVLTALTNDWLTDEYDVSLIDWSLTQLMIVDFQWLGVGRVRFYLVVDGVPRLFVVNSGTNNLQKVYMKNPNNPVRYEIRSFGSPGNFYMICSGVSMEGSVNPFFKNLGINNFTERTLPTGGVVYPLLGVRLGSNFRGVSGYFKDATVLQTTNDNYLFTLQKNPTLSSTPSWTAVTDTPIEYSQGDGSISVSTPGYVIASSIGKAATLGTDAFDFLDSAFSLGYKINGTSDQWWVCIQAVSNNAKFRVAANLIYFD